MLALLLSISATSALSFAPEVPLFPVGAVPGEIPGAIGPEYWVNKTTVCEGVCLPPVPHTPRPRPRALSLLALNPHLFQPSSPSALAPTLPQRTGYIARQKRNVSAPTITPFLATNCPPSGCPAVVVAPGGAYMLLSFSMEGTDVAERFNAMGVSAFVLKYRVPQRPAQPGVKGRETFGWAPLQDAQRAMGIVRSRAVEWKVDPSKIGFNGFSAGGHLTVHIATSWGVRTYPRVDAADDLPCRPDFALPIYPWKLLLNNDAASTVLAPEVSNVTAATPPLMIAQNEDDPSAHVENSLMLYYHLKRSAGRKPSSALHLYPTGGHGFGLCQVETENKECCDWPLAAQRFMQDQGFAPNWPAKPCDGVYDKDGSLKCH